LTYYKNGHIHHNLFYWYLFQDVELLIIIDYLTVDKHIFPVDIDKFLLKFYCPGKCIQKFQMSA